MINIYNLLTKHGTVVAFGLGLLGVLIFFLPVAGGMEDFMNLAEEDRARSDEGNMFLTGMYFTAFLIGLALVVAVIFGIIQVISDPKGATKGLIAIVGLAVIFGACYGMATEELAQKLLDGAEYNADGAIAKKVGAAIRGTTAIACLALLGLFVSEIRNFFK